ncbi:CUB domain-containing protein 1-like [Leucoraja erinacea]|uniref:CUB domain-containing protein 1-like n=1 Tax=Leucoraja erinaceus TaxID=7782 RepID=UPI0024590621|nr:CUB domain-containing protein 1-like [Leucoraja erinacea]
MFVSQLLPGPAEMPGVALSLVLLLFRLPAPGAEMVLVTTGLDVTINIRQAVGSPSFADCQMCIVGDGDIVCHQEYRFLPNVSLLINFTCADPQHAFIMDVKKDIGEDHDLEDLLPQDLPRLNTTYIWAINVPYKVGVRINFDGTPVWQTDLAHCPDLVQYRVTGHVQYDNTSEVPVGTFCRNGTISNLKIQGRTLITLEVPWSEVNDDTGFQLSFVPPIGMFSVVTAILQPGSLVYFMSANWPLGFPNDELMSWKVAVPPNYHATVTEENFTKPICVKREAGWFFGRSVLGKISGQFHNTFIITLQNCDMDYSYSSRLDFRFLVQVFNDYHDGFEIDLQRQDGVSVRLNQLLDSSNGLSCICRTPVSSDCAPELQVGPGDHLNVSVHFKCNPETDIAAEVTTNISCEVFPDCSIRQMDLVVPDTISSWPLAQQTFKWLVEAPAELTIELSTKRLKLQQLVPGERCDGNITYSMSTLCEHGLRSTLGLFCPGGAVDMIQTADTVSLELLTTDGWNTKDMDIRLAFVPRVTEDYIVKVSPVAGAPVHLLTPNWGEGMASKMTVSWDITVPEEQVVKLSFLNQSMPVCLHGHVFVSVDQQRDDSTVTNFRETDALPTHPLVLPHRFWLNVSNCEPEQGQLNLVVHLVVAQPEVTTDVLLIVAAAAARSGPDHRHRTGGVLRETLMCKRQRPPLAYGIYNPSAGRGKRRFGKSREDNESHIYAVIDEDRVYAAQFHKAQLVSIPEVDVYRPFQGPMGDQPPSRGPLPDAMVTNEIYTFVVKKQDAGTNGEMVTFLGSNDTPAS